MTTPAAPATTPATAAGAAPAPISTEALQALLQGSLFAPWVQQLALQVRSLKAGPGQAAELTLALPVQALHVHGGGVMCGQTLMAAADTAMVLAISAQLGGFRPMTTVQLQSSFLRPVPGDAGELTLLARVLKPGRQLVFGEIECLLPGGQLAMHATTTYALL